MSDFEAIKEEIQRNLETVDVEQYKKEAQFLMSMTDEEAHKFKMDNYVKERDDLLTPSKLNAAYTVSDFGTDLEKIEPFTFELTEIVDKMKEELVNEKRILEGTDVPEYDENELSTETKSKE